MIGSREWTAYFLWKNGELIEEHARRCPVTAGAVQSAPLCSIPGRAPSILFSRLTPGARIPPHAGFINTRLICHLPLVVPEKCVFRVGNDVRQWTVGETLIFDDTIEHEARNDSAKTRVVLIFDVWRPELTEEEQKLVTALLGAIDSYGVE
jgi:aspartyl/asparaginyl beta-hydroxylase (cupin superfamily)